MAGYAQRRLRVASERWDSGILPKCTNAERRLIQMEADAAHSALDGTRYYNALCLHGIHTDKHTDKHSTSHSSNHTGAAAASTSHRSAGPATHHASAAYSSYPHSSIHSTAPTHHSSSSSSSSSSCAECAGSSIHGDTDERAQQWDACPTEVRAELDATRGILRVHETRAWTAEEQLAERAEAMLALQDEAAATESRLQAVKEAAVKEVEHTTRVGR